MRETEDLKISQFETRDKFPPKYNALVERVKFLENRVEFLTDALLVIQKKLAVKNDNIDTDR